MNNQTNKKKVTITLIAVVVLVLTIGGAYALWTYSKTLGDQTLISGDIYMKFTEGNTVNIKEAMPSVTYNPDEYFEFSVEGKNKYSKDVVYEILLEEGEEPTGEGNETRNVRIKPSLLKFRLVEVTTDEEGNEQEEELIQEGSYDSIDERRIWVDKVPANTKENIKYTYRLYMWISNDAKIGNMKGADYTAQVWNNNVFASVKVAVNGDFNPKDLTEDYLILNASNESGEKYDLKQPIQSDEDITITLGSKREITKFVVEKSDQNPIALTSLPESTDYPAEYNPTSRAWEAKVTIDETGIYDYYAEYEAGKNSKTYSFTVLMNPDRFVKVEKPTSALCKQGLTYTGSPQDLIDESNLDKEGYTITQVQGTDAKEYEVKAHLKDKFRWSDSSQEDATFNCTIGPKTTTLTYAPTTKLSVAKGSKGTVKITAPTSGTFEVTSKASGTASVTFTPSSGTSTTVTVNGVLEGTTSLDIKFTPSNNNYTEVSDTYSIEVTKAPAVTQLKEKLGTGGLIAVTTSNTKTTEKGASNIREYRYSGATADNYVTFNDEKWRIIGIFKDEDGNEHMKIIRNELIKETDFPTTYQAEGTSFSIRYSGEDRAYWNSTKTGTNYNDWTTAGLMYWLNSKGTDSSDTGYLNKIKSPYKGMIEENAKWYLGNNKWGSSGDTTVTAYTNERDVSNIYSGNKGTWTGSIALMYPSDMGFSTDSSYWRSTKLYSFGSTQVNTTWLKEGHTTDEWFLSPSSFSSGTVTGGTSDGTVGPGTADSRSGVRPVLYLKSDTTINGGEGTSTTPYTLQ